MARQPGRLYKQIHGGRCLQRRTVSDTTKTPPITRHASAVEGQLYFLIRNKQPIVAMIVYAARGPDTAVDVTPLCVLAGNYRTISIVVIIRASRWRKYRPFDAENGRYLKACSKAVTDEAVPADTVMIWPSTVSIPACRAAVQIEESGEK